MKGIWLDPIPATLRQMAVESLEAGDWLGFLCTASSEDGLTLVALNLEPLSTRGIYEPALLHALTATRTNHHHWPMSALRSLLVKADRDRLRSAGARLPGPGPFTLYRGVAGRGTQRRVRGLSWTASFDRARYFATRFDSLPEPAVFRAVIDARDVLAYIIDLEEEEFLVWLRHDVNVERVWPEEEAT